jgi:hypothetical protein
LRPAPVGDGRIIRITDGVGIIRAMVGGIVKRINPNGSLDFQFTAQRFS